MTDPYLLGKGGLIKEDKVAFVREFTAKWTSEYRCVNYGKGRCRLISEDGGEFYLLLLFYDDVQVNEEWIQVVKLWGETGARD